MHTRELPAAWFAKSQSRYQHLPPKHHHEKPTADDNNDDETRPLAFDDAHSDNSRTAVGRGSSQGSCDEAVPHWNRNGGHARQRMRWLFVVLGVAAVSLLSGCVGALLGRRGVDLDDACARHTVQYSPILDDIQIKYRFIQFNGSFMDEDIYRQKASPEVDAAWEALGVDYRPMVIPYEQGLRSDLTDAHVQRSEKYGRGFYANVEGLHHLHCLNLLRKSLFFNYAYYKKMGTHAFSNSDDIVHLHVTHCLDTLRQVLMCNADTGLLGQVWIDPSDPTPFVDFNTRHKCKNFDDIRKWAEPRQAPLPETLPEDYTRLPNDGDIHMWTP